MQEVAKRPAGISGTVSYGNCLKALVCVLSTKGMVAMKNLCEIIQGLTGIFENHPEQKWAREMYYELLSMCRAADFYNQNPEIDSRKFYMDCLQQRYDAILEEAIQQNPISE